MQPDDDPENLKPILIMTLSNLCAKPHSSRLNKQFSKIVFGYILACATFTPQGTNGASSFAPVALQCLSDPPRQCPHLHGRYFYPH